MYLTLFEGMDQKYFDDFASPFCDNPLLTVSKQAHVLKGDEIGVFEFKSDHEGSKGLLGLVSKPKPTTISHKIRAPATGQVMHAFRPFALYFGRKEREIEFFEDREFNRNHVTLGLLTSNKVSISPWELHKDFFGFVRQNESFMNAAFEQRYGADRVTGWAARLYMHEQELQSRKCPSYEI